MVIYMNVILAGMAPNEQLTWERFHTKAMLMVSGELHDKKF